MLRAPSATVVFCADGTLRKREWKLCGRIIADKDFKTVC